MTLTNGEKYDGMWVHNKKHGTGWWRMTNGKVRAGEWRNDEFVRWTGPEQFETQLKLQQKLSAASNSSDASQKQRPASPPKQSQSSPTRKK